MVHFQFAVEGARDGEHFGGAPTGHEPTEHDRIDDAGGNSARPAFARRIEHHNAQATVSERFAQHRAGKALAYDDDLVREAHAAKFAGM